MIECIFRTYVVPCIPLLAALLVYLLGRRAYFRQKEYELITKRYLDEGLDAISRSVESSLATFRHNWWQSTVVLKHFRDLERDTPKDLYADPYLIPKTAHFEFWRDYRIQDLVGDQVFNRARQYLDAFEKESYAFFKYDLGTAVLIAIEGGKSLSVHGSIKDMVDSYIKEVEALDKRSKRFYTLLGCLQKLSAILQTERFSFRALRRLGNRKSVKSIVARLKEEFPDGAA
jgi:hypothetical protein